MNHINKWNKFNESGESNSVDSKFIEYLREFIKKGWLLDKEYLDDCFADLLDMGVAKHTFTTDSSKNFIDKYLVDRSTPVRAAFFYHIVIKLPKISGSEYSVASNLCEDYIEILSNTRDSIQRIESYIKENKYNPKFNIKQGKRKVLITLSTQDYYKDLCKEIGYIQEFGNGNSYNPITFLYNQIKNGKLQ